MEKNHGCLNFFMGLGLVVIISGIYAACTTKSTQANGLMEKDSALVIEETPDTTLYGNDEAFITKYNGDTIFYFDYKISAKGDTTLVKCDTTIVPKEDRVKETDSGWDGDETETYDDDDTPQTTASIPSGICGAPTKNGDICHRRVSDGGYCWQHC